VVHYRWYPLSGRHVRCILTERRASGKIAHVELEPGVVTMVAAWKFDAVHCSTLKVSAPQVSLAALSDPHRVLITCESRLISADGNTATQEGHDGIAGTARTSNGGGSESEACTLASPRQLDLILDDIRLQGMTAAERHVVLNALAQLLLEARGAVTTEAGDDDA
jgi:hypothetical protein